MVLTVVVWTLKEIECGVRSAQWAYGPHRRTVVVPLIASLWVSWRVFTFGSGLWGSYQRYKKIWSHFVILVGCELVIFTPQIMLRLLIVA